jgi:seryl-tRNA synthetase
MLDKTWKKLKYEEDNLRSERNKISEKINSLKNKEKIQKKRLTSKKDT